MMTARPRRSFAPEFKAQTVELIRTSGKSVGRVCRDLDLTETAVRRWIAQAHVDAGRRDGLTTAEGEELSQLRREVPGETAVRFQLICAFDQGGTHGLRRTRTMLNGNRCSPCITTLTSRRTHPHLRTTSRHLLRAVDAGNPGWTSMS